MDENRDDMDEKHAPSNLFIKGLYMINGTKYSCKGESKKSFKNR